LSCFPTDTTLPRDDLPSCSTMEAFEKQDLFVNDTLVTSALALLSVCSGTVRSHITVRS